MTIEFALEYIPRRMEELGYGKNYHLRMKYIKLQPYEKKTIEAYNQLVVLTMIGTDVRIESEMSVMEWNDETSNEWGYEHQGKIDIENYSSGLNYVQYIQVIPKFEKHADNK